MSTRQNELRVGVIGSLCSSDFVLADALIEAGVAAEVLRMVGERGWDDGASQLYPFLDDAHVRSLRSRLELILRLRSYDVIFSFTASLGFALGKAMYLFLALQHFGWPRYINISTGADITERSAENSWPGRLQRLTMRHAFAQGVPPYPEAIRAAARLGLSNSCLLPPVQLRIPRGRMDRPPPEEWRFRTAENELVLLSASHLDWGIEDAGPWRNSTKGNDRFFRALAEVVPHTDSPVRVVVIERGVDHEHARTLIKDLGLGNHVVWTPPMTRAELFEAMREADVVVDQFDIGALGMIAWEAFAFGRPVLTYVDRGSELLPYDEHVPILNAHTVEEIAERLRDVLDPDVLRTCGEAARNWAEERSTPSLLVRYLYFATVATGRAAADFGWNRPHGHP